MYNVQRRTADTGKERSEFADGGETGMRERKYKNGFSQHSGKCTCKHGEMEKLEKKELFFYLLFQIASPIFRFCKNHRKNEKMLLQTRIFLNFLTRYR